MTLNATGDADALVIGWIEEMSRDVAAMPAIYRPGAFWQPLLDRNIQMIREGGIANLKRTVSNNYYNWLVTAWKDPQYRAARKFWLRHPSLHPFLNRMEPASDLRIRTRDGAFALGAAQARTYKWFVSVLWEMARSLDNAGLTDRMEEPEAGNPIRIWRGKRRISQDLANSIIEYNFVHDAMSGAKRVAELGAGYGRLAHVHAEAGASIYCIFDIPPALAVAQWYLTAVLGRDRIRPYSRTFDLARLEQPASQGIVAFFSPDQLAQFPDGWFDLTQTISTLPEMPRAQSAHYLDLLARKSGGGLFLKQWRKWHNKADDVELAEESYSLPAPWRLVRRRRDPIQPAFFNQLWRLAS